MVFAGADGTIYDHPELEMAGVDGGEAIAVPARDLVLLPRGSDLFVLPDRNPIGIDPQTGRAVEYTGEGRPVSAVAAFLAPAHTLTHLPAYRPRHFAQPLPLFAYAAIGFAGDEFVAAGVRVDPDPRQDPWRFDRGRLEKQLSEGPRLLPAAPKKCARKPSD